jgi:hypothetical protein
MGVTGMFADLALQSLPEDLSAPPAGSARVHVLSATTRVPAVDVTLDGGPTLATALPFGGAGTAVAVPAGPSTVVVAGTRVPVTWVAGSIMTVLVLDSPDGGLTVRMVQDAAGPSAVPVGGVEAGGGAGLPRALPGALGALLALATGSRRGRVLAVVAAAVLATVPATGTAAAPVPAAMPVSLTGIGGVGAAAPVRLEVPAAGVDTALAPIDLDAAGALVPPSDDALAGWYRQGPAPGEAGPAVLTGHVDSTAGPAVFFRLREVAVGDAVTVTRADGTTVGFTVTRVARYAKGEFPTAEVYGPTPGAELRLITCGGAFDRAARSYLDNVVVYARGPVQGTAPSARGVGRTQSLP